MSVTRRDFLGAAGAALALELAGCAKPSAGPGTRVYAPGMTLRSAGESKGILAGCAVNVKALGDQPEYAALVAQQAGILVAENSMKFGPTQPGPTEFNFHEADELMAFAEKHQQKVRGHNFVWHRSLPAWFDKYVTPENAEHVLVDHIEQVGGRYAGRVHSWDVVNEAIRVEDKNPGGMRDTPWRKLMGDRYIDVAYRTARRVDPKALLTYNEYGIEGDDEGSKAKRIATLELLRGMQKRGVPIDALGVQSHIGSRWGGSTAGLDAFLDEVSRMGLKVFITEMDVNDKAQPEAIPERDQAVGRVYAAYLNAVLAHPAVGAVLTWGITDRATWLNSEEFGRADKLPERPLPFDAELKPKPAFFAEYDALRQAPRR